MYSIELSLAAPADTVSLVARIACGDANAESEFVTLYRAGVHALVRRRCRPLEPAVEDLVQEVILAVLQKLRAGALREEAALPAYVRSTAVMMVQAEYRKRANRGEHVSEELLDQMPVDARDRPASEDPSAQLQREQLAGRVRVLLAELSVTRDQEVLRRFYLQDHSREDICRDLGIDGTHFHRVLFRARERLAELARRDGLGEGG
jgi:RNA polymerase sigma-70 factor (ECF subfamily)